MNVLVGCEESQAVCMAFLERGHDAWSCDLQRASGPRPDRHYNEDIFKVIEGGHWDLLIGHPPCTYLSNAGNGYFNEERYGEKAILRKMKRMEAYKFFMKMWNCGIPKICLENPVGYINSIMKPAQTIHPYFFGNRDLKRTCLWLKKLPKLVHIKTDDLFSIKSHTDYPEPYSIDNSGKKRYFVDSKNRSSLSRSKTFPGIAKAMAEQWG